MKTERVARVRLEMKRLKMTQLLVTASDALFYLLGKRIEPGERLLALHLPLEGAATLVVNELFPISEDLGVELCVYNDAEPAMLRLAALLADGRLGIDKDWPARFLLELMEQRPGLQLMNGSAAVDNVRRCKDEEEKLLLRRASQINDAVMEKLIAAIRPGISERELARLLPDFYEAHGTGAFSFAPIVAFGKNGALPHHHTGGDCLQHGDAIILDIGGVTDGYCSDMTRSLCFGEADEEYKMVHQTVLEANRAAIAAVRPGVTFAAVDAAARDLITAAGYGPYFTHRTGHGIGLKVHEPGDVSASNQMELAPGMTFSIEPGIYLPGKFGVRIEDLVIVTEDGCEILNRYPKELQIIG